MKLAVYSRSLPMHGGGGMEKVAWDLMQEWAKRDVEIVCYTTPFEGQPAPVRNLRVVSLPGRSGRYSLKWWRATVSSLQDGPFDLILGVGQGAHAIVASGKADAPVLMQAHGTALDEIRTKLRVRNKRALASIPQQVWRLAQDLRYYRKYDSVIAIGHSVRRTILSYPMSFQPKALTLIENGVRVIDRTQLPDERISRGHFALNDSEPVALCVGRLHREKGVDFVIAALKSWNGQLLVVGDGPAAASLQKQARDLGVSDRVTFTGHLLEKDIWMAYQAATCVVATPRRVEGLSMVLLEALGLGLPIVTTTANANSLGKDAVEGVHAIDGKKLSELGLFMSSVKLEKRTASPARLSLTEVAESYLKLFRETIEEVPHSGLRNPTLSP